MSIPASIAQDFHTDGNGIRLTDIANIGGNSALYIAELDGGISCYQMDGTKLWRVESQAPAVMFEIEAADIDGDGDEDVLAASGDGHIYCWKSDGTLLWKFAPTHKVRLSEVAVVKNGTKTQIFAGGNDFKLYEISTTGTLISDHQVAEGVVRQLEAGNFIDPNKNVLYLHTLALDKVGSRFCGFIDPDTKKIIKSGSINNAVGTTLKGFIISDVCIADVDKDGKDDVINAGYAGSSRGSGSMAIFNGNLDSIGAFQAPQDAKQRYAHSTVECLLPNKNQLVMKYGGVLFVTDLKGKLIERHGEAYQGMIFNDLVFDSTSGYLIGGGEVGGGNGLYFHDTNADNWWKTEHKSIGRFAEVQANLNDLYQKTLNYKMPSYQKKPNKEWVMQHKSEIRPEVQKLNGQKLSFITSESFQENTPRDELVAIMGDVALKRDGRGNYEDTREEIIEVARQFEVTNQPFTISAGHGSDPFKLHIETMEKIIEVAPTTCYGFMYGEMADHKDPRNKHWAEVYVPRLAIAKRKHKSPVKVYMRYKDMFWAAHSHLEPWKTLFFSNKYNDILIPTCEDTNNRVQDLNFSGRVGMFAAGYVDDYGIRLVDDNPTSWRPASPGGQRSVSPYLRNAVLQAAYGARYGVIFTIKYLEDPGFNILFALMKSGVIPIVEKEDILSMGAWHVMESPNLEIMEKGAGGHSIEDYTIHDDEAVVSVNTVAWCGANVPDHDYSKTLGVDYRWLNFIPSIPNGMVPIVPFDYEDSLKAKQIDYFKSDLKHGFVDNQKVDARTFGSTMNAIVDAGREKMKMKVDGASWAAIKLDSSHVRLVLIDPGYIDPQKRDVTVTFMGETPSYALDILSGQDVSISGNAISIKVPAGSMRFIDLEYTSVQTNKVTSVSITPKASNLALNDSIELKATVLPLFAADKSIKWTTDSTHVVNIDEESGKMKALGGGIAYIYATSANGVYDSCKVQILSPKSMNTYRETFENATPFNSEFYVGDSGYEWLSQNQIKTGKIDDTKGVMLKAGGNVETKVIPTGISSFSCFVLNASTSNRVLQLSINGEIVDTAHYAQSGVYEYKLDNLNILGDFKLSFKNATPGTDERLFIDNVSWTDYVLNDQQIIEDFTLSKTMMKLFVDEQATLNPIFTPSNVFNKSIVWSSDNENIVSVANGLVTAHKTGKATIKAITNEGNYVATCDFTVEAPYKYVTGIKLNKQHVFLNKNEYFNLTYTLSPDNASYKSVYWISLDKSIATVSDNGVVTGVSTGNTEIVVVSHDGNYRDTCKVSVGNHSAIDRVNALNVNFYPNPFNNNIRIVLPENHTFNYLSLIDITGRMCLQKEITKSTTVKLKHLNGLKSGLYMIRLISDTDIYITKILKQQ